MRKFLLLFGLAALLAGCGDKVTKILYQQVKEQVSDTTKHPPCNENGNCVKDSTKNGK